MGRGVINLDSQPPNPQPILPPEPCSLPPWPSPSLKHQARDEKSVRMHRATDSARC